MTLSQLDLIPGSGDQLLTLDSETDLEWFNLTATANKSYFQVLAGFGGFIGAHGFAYGTAGQVSTMFKHAGITRQFSAPPSTDMVNFLGVQTLAHFMNGWVFATGPSPNAVPYQPMASPTPLQPKAQPNIRLFLPGRTAKRLILTEAGCALLPTLSQAITHVLPTYEGARGDTALWDLALKGLLALTEATTPRRRAAA